MSRDAALIVIAKQPRPGRSKTRLTPPCTPVQAATLAGAALVDTLETVAAVPAARRIVVFEGEPGPWVPSGFEVLSQADGGLDRRLESAFAEVAGPALLVGMDTPQLTPLLLRRCMRTLGRPGTDAVLGFSPDGGFWGVGLESYVPGAFTGVPMSSESTGAAQLVRLCSLGLRCAELPILLDVDTFDDAIEVAAQCPGTHFSATFASVQRTFAGPQRSASAWAVGR